MLEPAPSRITPGCEYYGRCGGCHYQHADYAAQLAMKRSHPHRNAGARPRSRSCGDPRSLRRSLGLSQPHPPARQPASAAALSYREAASHRDLPVTHCPVAAPILQQAIAAFNELLQKQPALATTLSEVEFFTTADESALLVSLFTQRKSPEHLPRSVADALLPTLPALTGVRTFSLDPKTRRTQPSAAWGQPSLDYAVGPLQLSGQRRRILPGESLPRPRHCSKKSIAQRSGSLAWDLYAGVGLFAQALAQRFEQVIAVESSPASTADLTRNLHGAGHKRIAKDTLRFLKSPPAAAPRPGRSRPAARRPRR